MSLGVFIGAEGDVVSPLSVLNVVRSTGGPQVRSGQNVVTDLELYDLGLLFIGGYRVPLRHKSNPSSR